MYQWSFLPRAIIFCFLCKLPTTLPYTKISLKRKKDLSCHFLRLFFLRRPRPNNTRSGLARGCPSGPKEFSTALMCAEFSLSKLNRFIMIRNWGSKRTRSKALIYVYFLVLEGGTFLRGTQRCFSRRGVSKLSGILCYLL